MSEEDYLFPETLFKIAKTEYDKLKTSEDSVVRSCYNLMTRNFVYLGVVGAVINVILNLKVNQFYWVIIFVIIVVIFSSSAYSTYCGFRGGGYKMRMVLDPNKIIISAKEAETKDQFYSWMNYEIQENSENLSRIVENRKRHLLKGYFAEQLLYLFLVIGFFSTMLALAIP